MNILYVQDGSMLTICVYTCEHAGWKAVTLCTDACDRSNHNTAENPQALWARALQAKENASENKQPPG